MPQNADRGRAGGAPTASWLHLTQLTAAELGELYAVREALAAAALGIAVRRAGPDDDVAAASAHSATAVAMSASDPGAYSWASRRFHFPLLAPSGMRRLLHMLESAWNATEPVQPMSLLGDDMLAVLHSDHHDMLAAYRDRDVSALTRAAAIHHRRLAAAISQLPPGSGGLLE